MDFILNQQLLSVCLITYNHSLFIRDAIESILKQKTQFRYELIIADDKSTDGTRNIILEYKEKHPDLIRLIFQDENVGPRNNWNDLINSSNSRYIAYLEGDDYWLEPGKLQEQVDFLESNPGYGIVYSDILPVDKNGLELKSQNVEMVRKNYKSGFVFSDLLKGNFINTCTVVFRRDLIPDGTLDMKKYWFFYDYWLWLRMSIKCKIHYMDKKTAAYRIHENGLSRSPSFRDKKKSYYLFLDALLAFDRENNRILNRNEKMMIFRKLGSLLFQRYGDLRQKSLILNTLVNYYPGVKNIFRILKSKVQ